MEEIFDNLIIIVVVYFIKYIIVKYSVILSNNIHRIVGYIILKIMKYSQNWYHFVNKIKK